MKKGISDESQIRDPKTCFLCSFPPRGCGIATFSKDLSTAMDLKFNPKLKSKILAINDADRSYDYDDKVIMQMRSEDIDDYIEKAKEINESKDIKIISIQHEFGLYGGEYGSYLIPFLEVLEKPVVVTFHTVLPKPDLQRIKIVRSIAKRASAITVMAKTGKEILINDYKVPSEKIHVVHHGIHNVPFEKSDVIKQKLGLDTNRTILSSFGLLSRGKGIEYSIQAIPKLVKKYPNILYRIIGQTHPVVKREEGEEYREYLTDLVSELGISKNVEFYNKYLPLDELLLHIRATDIYLCTNLERNQLSSGTLAYAMGCGRVVVSTPILYAEELLAENRGVIAKKFKAPKTFVGAIDRVLSSPQLKETIEKNAYKFSRQMTWQNVAFQYLKIFNNIIKLRDEVTEKYPSIKFNHVRKMTDDFGMIQFANESTPDKTSGYTLDDNTRALIAVMHHNNITKSEENLDLAKIYLDFIKKSQLNDGTFKNNFLNIEETTNPTSEDAFGRTIWALGFTIKKTSHPELLNTSKKILVKAFKNIEDLKSPRSIAFTLIGLHYYYQSYQSKEVFIKIKELANILLKLYNKTATDEWQWFENYLTYANAKLPLSLFMAYSSTGDERYLITAKKTLNFLTETMFIDRKLYPIGQKGWYQKDSARAFFDQQPIDASSIVKCLLTAYYITGNNHYYEKAVIAFNWFFGYNHLNQMIYDETTGGCFDGLGRTSLNFNQGAESTLSYLTARLYFEEFKKIKEKKEGKSQFT